MKKIIVYEHASNGCLSRYLNDASFSWYTRLKICIDIANGLKYLHGGDGGQDVVIHRDIKSSNILLTKDWKAKICGFELSLTYPTNQKMELAISDVVGSPGYCDPLYWKTHTLTKESDIYSLGVVLFEILCGRSACLEEYTDEYRFLDVSVKRHFQEEPLNDILFEGIKEQIVLKSLFTFQEIAFQCLHEKREERPTAGEVVTELQKALEYQEAFEIWEAKLPRNYKEILQSSKCPKTNSTIATKDIYNTLSKGILLKDDNLSSSSTPANRTTDSISTAL
ncbi:probable receptor-like protein kinase At5g38990 [Helianthus annuus]|uniref:probable receptor-like protein kinase At5g38990 n=1 Tax=Helianthus annuus TaxID=4232 RepID=UPI000B8FB110|nr:probable receptor-like protein kinase At5g38990 [Helianthus annuus]